MTKLKRGGTPIEKNIRVVDERGNEYEATWPKRAKGLAKNGRACFINETTLMLVRPPKKTEGKMENLDRFDGQIERNEQEDRSNGPRPYFSHDTNNEPTLASGEAVSNQELIGLIGMVLSKIDTISDQTQHLTEAISTVNSKDWSIVTEDTVDKVMNGLTAVVREREETNRESLRLLEKIIDNMIPKAEKRDINQLAVLGVDWGELLGVMNPKEMISFLRELTSL